MASARNMVLAGDYTGCRVFRMSANLAYISGTMKKIDDIYLVPEHVACYELMNEETIASGNSLLLTGSLDPGNLQHLRLHATKKMQDKGIFTVAIKFHDNKRALIEIDEKIFAAFKRRMKPAAP